ncbi:hypothetical protein EVAR_17640_1 [Eumeta japonica]|uniref:Uncharacterized protein n=1 Tax=Eumeta variegata TaxID=151549 RepID=A0A4C1USY8_EUMVA|nr:hypothetical protein EVAR_17640_1 [Eumeta japonica]
MLDPKSHAVDSDEPPTIAHPLLDPFLVSWKSSPEGQWRVAVKSRKTHLGQGHDRAASAYADPEHQPLVKYNGDDVTPASTKLLERFRSSLLCVSLLYITL